PVPRAMAKLVLERKVTPPPPPPPPPKVDPVPTLPEARPVPQPQEQPRPVDRTQEARQKASQAGLLPFQDQLAALRDSAVVDKVGQTKNLIGTASGTTRAERSLITSKVGTGGGGMHTASLSRGYGGGGGSVGG